MTQIDLDYGAITIDTSVFDNNGIALERGLLKQMDQFKGGPVQVLMSEIVDREVIAHLSEKIKESRSKINQAIRAAKSQLRITDKDASNAKTLLFDVGGDVDVAKGRLGEYYISTGSEIVECNGRVEISKLVKMYFEFNPPFERSADKKNEFPDALALLSLEKWAEENDTKVLAVSSDKGWANYANTSIRIDVVDNLSDAISHFQPHNFARNIIDSIKNDYVSSKSNDVLDSIAQGIIDSLDGIDIYVEASSSFSFEEDDVYATYSSHELYCDAQGKPEINIIRVESDLLILQVTAYVTCSVHASFGLSVWDSIDKEYIGMGSTSAEIEENYVTEVLISLSGEISKGLESVD